MPLNRRLILSPGDIVETRFGADIILTESSEFNEFSPVSTMNKNDIALVVAIVGVGTSQAVYVITSHGSGWVAVAEIGIVYKFHSMK